MASDPPSQPYYLTLTELALNYTLFAAVGYWVAASNPDMAASSDQAIQQASEKTPSQVGFPTPNRSEKKF